jgi:hypothetical protein
MNDIVCTIALFVAGTVVGRWLARGLAALFAPRGPGE